MSNFILLDKHDRIVKKLKITAVVGYIFIEPELTKIVAVKGKRGWDVPGGHVELNETNQTALKREVLEETSCVVSGIKLLAVLQSVKWPDTGISIYGGTTIPASFKPNSEITEVRYLEINDFSALYFGDKILLSEILKYVTDYIEHKRML